MLNTALELKFEPLEMHAQLGFCLMLLRVGRYDEAEKAGIRVKELAEKQEDKKVLAAFLNNLGTVAHEQGKYDDAEKLYQESLKICREIGDRYGIAASLNSLGLLHVKTNNLKFAREELIGDLSVSKEISNLQTLIEGLMASSTLLIKVGEFEKGSLALIGATHQAKLKNYNPYPLFQRQAEEAMRQAEKLLSVEELRELKSRAERMTLKELAAFALTTLEGIGD